MEIFLQVEQAVKLYGDISLFKNVSFTVNKGDKVALVARNGTGKTTLLNILAGKDGFDSGKFNINKDIRVSYLPQDPQFIGGMTIFDTVYGAPGKRMEVVRNYEDALVSGDQNKIEKAMAAMDFHQTWDLDSKIHQVLGILNLNDANQKTDTLSGGQIKRLALAVALLNDPDFLILDEPTNHLDLEMIEWLEEYLNKPGVTVLMVTHDRYFLDRICNQIIEIDEGLSYSYKGNYRLFLEKREERITNKAQVTDKARNLLHRELDWMRRMPKARTTKAKYRIDAFYDLKEKAEYKRSNTDFEINTHTSRLGQKILKLNQISKRFDNTIILDEFSYTFSRGEKLGIIGDNGVGKSTFLNIIMGLVIPDQGSLEHGETVIYGYYKQEGMKFKEGQKVLDIIQEIAEVVTLGDGKQIPASQFLNRFLFPPELQHVQVERLSGGERRRLYLLTVLMRNPNFLILDEPTNDFDIITLNILEEYLKSFNGCLILVSHDRFFMDKIVDHLFVFEGKGMVFDFPGNYSDFKASGKTQQLQTNKKEVLSELPETEIKNPPSITASKRKLSFKEKREFESISQEITMLENEKSELETQLSSGTLNTDDLIVKSGRISEIITLLDQKTERWFELSEDM